MNYDAVIVASGKGQRANLGYNKDFYIMKDGKSVLDHSVQLFCDDPDCKNVIVVTNPENFEKVMKDEKVKITQGGKERKDSVYNGLKLSQSDYVFIHDGARPFLKKDVLEQLKEKVAADKAVCLGHFATDTVKIVSDGKIEKTVDRNTVFLAETPQAFERELILDCYKRCEDVLFTDDASLAESLGYAVSVLNDPYDNRKLTKEEDFKNL